MATLSISVTYDKADYFKGNTGMGFRTLISRMLRFLPGVAAGNFGSSALAWGTTKASGTFTFSSASGTTTATINGVAFQQTTGTDAARGAALSAAVNASTNALVQYLVTASDDGAGVVTITAYNAGTVGNTNTIAASGTGLAASGARLTGGTTTVLTRGG